MPAIAARSRTSACQFDPSRVMASSPSRGLDTRDFSQHANEPRPLIALRGEPRPSRIRDPVVAAATLAGLFDPAAADQAAFFEAIERGVERSEREAERARRSLLDPPPNLVAVERFLIEQRQDEEIRAALLRRFQRRSLRSSRVWHMQVVSI